MVDRFEAFALDSVRTRKRKRPGEWENHRVSSAGIPECQRDGVLTDSEEREMDQACKGRDES